MQISFLADYPQHLPTVASWVFDEWGRSRQGVTIEKVEARFRNHLQRNSLPLTLLALQDGNPLGTASLQLTDMYTRPELTPWLAAVYVHPESRNQGIGSNLVQTSQEVARQLQIDRLYLFTPDREDFYAHLGWSVLERTEFRSQQVVIMTYDLNGDPSP
jgi:N-acetylglutamate synthase-like GNAT family acetyltransferase